MKTKEWKFIDKSKWKRGAWDSEPDKMQWEDEETRLPCLIRRGPMGAWCGYVALPRSHPFYKKQFEHCDNEPINVHGGLTFSNVCSDDKEHGICHDVDGKEEKVWWLGFDCGHLGDLHPKMGSIPSNVNIFASGTYRDISYAKAETTTLARQLKQVETEAK